MEKSRKFNEGDLVLYNKNPGRIIKYVDFIDDVVEIQIPQGIIAVHTSLLIKTGE